MDKLSKRPVTLPEKLEDLQKFILIGREQLTSVKAFIRAIDKVGMATAVREQKKEEATMLAGALLDAEVKVGELLDRLPPQEGGKEGKFKNKLPAGMTHKQSHIYQTLAKNKEVVEQVKAEAETEDDLPTRTEVLRRIKEKEKSKRIEREKQARNTDIIDIEIRKGDFKTVLDDVYDIDAIITDPPYPAEYLPCYSELGLFAKNHLKKDGFLVAYSGHASLPEVLNRLSEHLTYVWTFCLYQPGSTKLLPQYNLMVGWKPIVIFSNGKKKLRYSAYDVMVSEKGEKHSHEWQQSESGVIGLIKVFSEPDELIVDPFAGSGTFGKVAIENGRKFIGAEIK